ncbi:MAG: hypothetical protein ACT4PU_05600 [Planctomycetota bacterium]
MKQPGTLTRHEDREYLLVEAGFNTESRAVVLLTRPGHPVFPGQPGAAPLTWGRQGAWIPVARQAGGELHLPDSRHEPGRALAQKLIAAHVASHVLPKPVAWVTQQGESYTGTLEVALPMGLAVTVHEGAPPAAAASAEEQIVPVTNLGMFFTHLVREGYAGAMWNGEQPVYFCADDSGELHFLRVKPGPQGDTVELEILDERDAWEAYDGAEEIAFIDNRQACDERLVQFLGAMPLRDWPEDARLWSVGRAGVPEVLAAAEADAPRHALLFTSAEAAQLWRDEAEDDADLAVFAVDDLQAFLTQEALQGCVAQLNPGGHRAASGALWSDGERVVLDSFSGFWQIAEGAFHPID